MNGHKENTEYLYMLKNENTNKYYIGQTTVGAKRLSAHQSQVNGFKFTDYIIVAVPPRSSKEAEKDFITMLYYHQVWNSEEKEAYEKEHWDYIQKWIKKYDKDHEHFTSNLFYEIEYLEYKDFHMPHFNFGIDWWKSGLGYSSIQSFEDRDLLDYLLNEEFTELGTDSMGERFIRPWLTHSWYRGTRGFNEPLKWQKYKKYSKYKLIEPKDILLYEILDRNFPRKNQIEEKELLFGTLGKCPYKFTNINDGSLYYPQVIDFTAQELMDYNIKCKNKEEEKYDFVH